jgi:hypothetical protein
MAYVGFDLDETLGSFSSAHSYIFFLTPGPVYTSVLKGQQPFVPSEQLREKLTVGLNEFAKCLLVKEPGILRTGILDIISRLLDLKEDGRVKAISIYSNNGNLGLLLLASAMIENAIGKPGIFCNHIDWYNPMRSTEITPGRPGYAVKTLRVLKQSFLDPRCGGDESTEDAKFYFFDDLQPPHDDLMSTLTNQRYFIVKPYKKNPASLENLEACLDSALKTAGLDTDDEYLRYVAPLISAFGEPISSYENIFKVLRNFNRSYISVVNEFENDTATLLSKIDASFPPLPASAPAQENISYGENFFPVDGGRRKGKGRRRRTIVKKLSKKIKYVRKTHKRPRKN